MDGRTVFDKRVRLVYIPFWSNTPRDFDQTILNLTTFFLWFNRLFERGAKSVGLDFMPHVFWDKYIEFFESKEEYAKLVQLMDRIIKIPMHQYARFFEK